MKTITLVFAKISKLAQELSGKLGKEIEVKVEENNAEIDKIALGIIIDSLIHLVRNAVDHGIESKEDRKKAGKNEKGLLIIRAFKTAGHIRIEVKDDGRGINPDSIMKKAREKRMISSRELKGLSEENKINFIFKQGFSTSPKITFLSGRGVGLDTVKTNIERQGGSVELRSLPGIETSILINLPKINKNELTF